MTIRSSEIEIENIHSLVFWDIREGVTLRVTSYTRLRAMTMAM
jgi:hypothetical protein